MELEDFIKEGARKMGFSPTPQELSALIFYLWQLQEHHFLGLTAFKTQKQQAEFLILESFPFLNLIPARKLKLLDLGSGAGIPGVVVKILRKDLEVHLLEAEAKKVSFLQNLLLKLKYPKFFVVDGRAETLGRDELLREKFDLVLARGVAPLRVLLELSFPFLKPEGRLLAQKGEKAPLEIKAAENALKILKGELVCDRPYQLPYSKIKGRILELKKLAEISETFPRRVGIPKKRPL